MLNPHSDAYFTCSLDFGFGFTISLHCYHFGPQTASGRIQVPHNAHRLLYLLHRWVLRIAVCAKGACYIEFLHKPHPYLATEVPE